MKTKSIATWGLLAWQIATHASPFDGRAGELESLLGISSGNTTTNVCFLAENVLSEGASWEDNGLTNTVVSVSGVGSPFSLDAISLDLEWTDATGNAAGWARLTQYEGPLAAYSNCIVTLVANAISVDFLASRIHVETDDEYMLFEEGAAPWKSIDDTRFAYLLRGNIFLVGGGLTGSNLVAAAKSTMEKCSRNVERNPEGR